MYLLFNVLPSFHFSLSHTHTISLSLSYAHTHTHTHTPPSLPFAGHDGVVFDAVWTKQFVVRCVISKPRSLFVFGSSQLCSQLPCHEDLMGLSCNIPPPPFFFSLPAYPSLLFYYPLYSASDDTTLRIWEFADHARSDAFASSTFPPSSDSSAPPPTVSEGPI